MKITLPFIVEFSADLSFEDVRIIELALQWHLYSYGKIAIPVSRFCTATTQFVRPEERRKKQGSWRIIERRQAHLASPSRRDGLDRRAQYGERRKHNG